MGHNGNSALQATPADLLHGWCAGLVKTVLSMSLSVLLAVTGSRYSDAFAEICRRMANMPRFPNVAGFAVTKFNSGVSNFVSTTSHRAALKTDRNTLICGLGLHSKAYVTMLFHFALAFLPGGLPGLPTIASGQDPVHIVAYSIFVTISTYMEVRRKK